MKREALAKLAISVIPAKAGIQNALKTGFRVALRSPGMTTFHTFQEFCKRLKGYAFPHLSLGNFSQGVKERNGRRNC
jgi:hypothetical protein